jgi:hypothetical protein
LKVEANCLPNDGLFGFEPGDTGSQTVQLEPQETPDGEADMIVRCSLKLKPATFNAGVVLQALMTKIDLEKTQWPPPQGF